jgi:hypothetical protein
MSEYQANSDAELGSGREDERDVALRDLCVRARPVEPVEAEWNGVWSNVVAALDAPAVIAMPERRRSGFVLPSWSVLAQAAAVLLMVTLLVPRFRSGEGPEAVAPVAQRSDVPPETSPTTLGMVDIPEGELMVIHIGADGLRTTELPRDDRPNALDESYTFLNRMEAIGE